MPPPHRTKESPLARGRKSSRRLVLSPEEREPLERWQRSTTIAAGLARRGKILLLLAAGQAHSHVAQAVGVQRPVVRQWARRFRAQRRDGLADAPGRGATGGFSPSRRDARGASGLRTPRHPGPSPLAGGWRRTGPAAHGRWPRGGPLGRYGASVLAAHQLNPWRQHVWLSPQPPRAAAFSATVSELLDLDTRPLRPAALVLSVDEQTALQ